jgi:hypothetical protein
MDTRTNPLDVSLPELRKSINAFVYMRDTFHAFSDDTDAVEIISIMCEFYTLNNDNHDVEKPCDASHSILPQKVVDNFKSNAHVLHVSSATATPIVRYIKDLDNPNKVPAKILKRVKIKTPDGTDVAFPFLPHLIDYTRCCGNILGCNQLFTPCLTHVSSNNSHCKPCTKLINDGKIDGDIEERTELFAIGRMFTGRHNHNYEISYSEYLQSVGYYPGIDGINAELRSRNIPLVIPDDPPFDQEFDISGAPRPLPGKIEEFHDYSSDEMLFWDYKYNIYAKDPEDDTKFVKVGYDDMHGAITALPGCQHYFEEHRESLDDEDNKYRTKLPSELTLSCVINGEHYGAIYKGDNCFDLHHWRGWGTFIGYKPVATIVQLNENNGFFNAEEYETKQIQTNTQRTARKEQTSEDTLIGLD